MSRMFFSGHGVMGVGAGGAPPRFGQNAVKNSGKTAKNSPKKKKEKILKCRTEKAKKIIQRVYPVLQLHGLVSLKIDSRLGLLKSMFNIKNFICRLFCLTLVISAQFTFEVEVTA